MKPPKNPLSYLYPQPSIGDMLLYSYKNAQYSKASTRVVSHICFRLPPYELLWLKYRGITERVHSFRKDYGVNETSFADVLKEYRGMIYHVLKTLKIADDEKEFYHIATIALWKAVKTFDESKGTFSTYAYASIRGELLTELKKRTKYSDVHSLFDDFSMLEESTDFEMNEDFLWLSDISKQLTTKQKQWLFKYVVEGKSPSVIANELGVTASQVKSWRKGAIQKIKAYLEEEKL